MHPRVMVHVLRRDPSGACGCSPGHESAREARSHRHYADPGEGGFGGSAFGVRRPLRFLAWKLQLDERQVTEMAAVLDSLKTERAQSEVDDRRSLAQFADAMAGETFDPARAEAAAKMRTDSAQRLQAEVGRALGRMHALLDAEQRSRLAYLIRTGTVAI